MCNGRRIVGTVIKSVIRVWTCIAVAFSAALTVVAAGIVSVVGVPQDIIVQGTFMGLYLPSLVVSVTGVAILKGAGEPVKKLVLNSVVVGIVGLALFVILF